MKIDTFFEKLMCEEYPNTGWFRRWWERKKLDLWLKLPSRHTGYKRETNKEFVENILEND